MGEMPRFCTNCGSPLSPGKKFCGQCGQRVEPLPTVPAPMPYPTQQPVPQPMPYPAQQPAPYPAPQPEVPSESIVAIVPNVQRRKGFLGMGAEVFNLVVTPGRLVFVAVSQQTMKDAVAAANAEAKRQGKGVLGQIAAQMGWVDLLCRQYVATPVETILAQYPGSFFIPLNQLVRITLREPAYDPDQANNSGQMIVESAAGKQRFEMPGASAASDARRTLKQALPGLVR
jgi:hypothetical protein